MDTIKLAELHRGPLVESVHRGAFAVVDAEEKVIASGGNVNYLTYMRSAAKPMQALPVVESGAADYFGLTEEEIAVLTSSHSGEEIHRRLVSSILNKIGLKQEMLQCGTHRPLHNDTAKELLIKGVSPDALHCSCSGKHSGMLLLCKYNSWDMTDYHQPHHPVQQLMIKTLAEISNEDKKNIVVGIDGCGVPVFGLSLYSMALAYARFAKSNSLPDRSFPITRIIQSMIKYPQAVAGTGRFATDLMQAAPGRLFAKDGAEGVFCLGIPDKGWGLAVKIENGNMKAIEPVIVSILEQLNILEKEELEKLTPYRFPKIRNFRKEIIGELQPVFKI
ncbi:MAG: asparaginase [Bacillota bacterium]